MSKPARRILAVLELLQSHGTMAGSELARRLDVDVRTVRRYVAGLDELGIPVVADRGRDGGYRLLQGFKLPPMLFTNDEALVLALGLRAAQHLGLADAGAAAGSAFAKLERVMPDKVRQRVHSIGENMGLDIARSAAAQVGDVLTTLSAAAHRRQQVWLQYRAQDGSESERHLDPYGLALLSGCWYVVGHCHLRDALRSFRLDRIRATQPVPASFGRPDDFDALAWLTRSIAVLPRAHAVHVMLDTDVEQARQMVAFSLGVLEASGDATSLYCQADDLDWMARELARLPCRFQVLGPDALRDALATHAARLMATAHSSPTELPIGEQRNATA